MTAPIDWDEDGPQVEFGTADYGHTPPVEALATRLSQTQADLAASQADLTRAKRDCEALAADNQDLTGERDELVGRSLVLKEELAEWQQHAARHRAEINRLEALLVERADASDALITELERLRSATPTKTQES